MAYKRKRSWSNKSWGKKRRYSRRRNVRRSKTIGRTLIHNFKRTYELFFHDPVGAGVTFRAIGFRLSDVPSVTDFINLYDNFRINKVKLKFYYDVDGIVDPGRGCGWLTSVIDFTDIVPCASLNEMYEYRTCKITSLAKCNERHTLYFTPKVASEIYKTSVTTAYTTPRKNPWISTSDTTTPHFGLKYATDGQGIGTEAALKCLCTMYFQCKSVK